MRRDPGRSQPPSRAVRRRTASGGWIVLGPLLGLGLSAAPAHAETTRLRGGEHGAYSRVLIDAPAPEGWTVSPTPQGAVIRLPGPARDYEVSEIAIRRLAHRVRAVETTREEGADVITLRFTCDCAAETKLFGGRLTLDVRERTEATAPDVPQAGTSPTPDAPTPDAPTPDASSTADAGESPEPDAETAAETNADADADPNGAAAPATDVAEAASGDPVEIARLTLMAQLQKAAEQGFVRFTDDADVPSPAPDAASDAAEADLAEADLSETDLSEADLSETDLAATPPSEAQEALDPAAAANAESGGEGIDLSGVDAGAPNPATAADTQGNAPDGPQENAAVDAALAALRAASGDDDPEAAPPAEAAPEPEPIACAPDAVLDFDGWRDPRPFTEALAAHRIALFDEVNRADTVAVANMMRFYLSYGLGLEAAYTPASFRVSTPTTRFLGHLADVVSGEPPREGSPFADGTPCSGLHGVLRAAALAETNPERALAAYAYDPSALADLPTDLRRRLGARIGLAVLSVGAIAEASDIDRLLSRTVDTPTRPMLLLRGELALEIGSNAEARHYFRRLLMRRDHLSPLAAIGISKALPEADDGDRAAEIADILSDFARQYRGSELGLELVRAEAALRSRHWGVAAGNAVFATRISRRPAQSGMWRRARAEVFRDEIDRALAIGDDAHLLYALQALEMLDDSPGSDAARLRVARAALDAGAPSFVALAIDRDFAERSRTAARLRAEALGGAAPIASPNPTAAAETDAQTPVDAASQNAASQNAPTQEAPINEAAPNAAAPDAMAADVPAASPDRPAEGTPLERGRELVDAVRTDIDALKEIVSDG